MIQRSTCQRKFMSVVTTFDCQIEAFQRYILVTVTFCGPIKCKRKKKRKQNERQNNVCVVVGYQSFSHSWRQPNWHWAHSIPAQQHIESVTCQSLPTIHMCVYTRQQQQQQQQFSMPFFLIFIQFKFYERNDNARKNAKPSSFVILYTAYTCIVYL